jgi:hypothetical protein
MGYFDSLGVNESEAWRPWTVDGKKRMGGYVVTWPGNLSYLTIRGSGHSAFLLSAVTNLLSSVGVGPEPMLMPSLCAVPCTVVPEYKPAATLAFIKAFVSGEEYPRYVSSSSQRRSRFT